jgi:hypothetical protein
MRKPTSIWPGRIRFSFAEPGTLQVSSDIAKLIAVHVTARMPARTALIEGEAKTSPQTAAFSMLAPTNPARAGSSPDPPPETTASRDLSRSDLMATRMNSQPSNHNNALPEAETRPSLTMSCLESMKNAISQNSVRRP